MKECFRYFAAAALWLSLLGAPSAMAQGVELFAVLLGGNEVNAAVQAGKGDPDGYGTASFILAAPGQICFALTVHNIDLPTAAHIHRGRAAVPNGGVVVTLSAPVAPSNGSPGTASGCVSGISTTTLAQIRNVPSDFYVNVHTQTFGAGALRGQLF